MIRSNCVIERNRSVIYSDRMQPLRVAIAGVGTVGGGVAQILHTHRALLAQRCAGRALQLVAVADQRPLDALSAELEGHQCARVHRSI